MIKCYMCGAWNHKDDENCAHCGRGLRFSPFLQEILRPSIGAILGSRKEIEASPLAKTLLIEPPTFNG